MTRSRMIGLFAGVSATALALSMASAPAGAFDKVYWGWNAYIHEYVDIDAYIDVHLDPTGMVMVEDLQIFIGDVKASSEVKNVYNFQRDGGPVAWDGKYDRRHQNHRSDPRSNALAELPEVVSAATAVANNTSIETDASLQLHEGQFAFGDADFNGTILSSVNSVADGGYRGGSNTHLEMASELVSLALFGILDSTEIEAKSEVRNILNATVDSSATAVANNLTVAVEARGDDRMVIGDVVQFAVANVEAKSEVSSIYRHNYGGAGAQLSRPIVSSVATAVGNNKSITVRAPTVAAP